MLDLAGGTGDIAFRILEAGGAAVRVIGDISAEMIEAGPRSGEGWRAGSALRGNAEACPSRTASFDA